MAGPRCLALWAMMQCVAACPAGVGDAGPTSRSNTRSGFLTSTSLNSKGSTTTVGPEGVGGSDGAQQLIQPPNHSFMSDAVSYSDALLKVVGKTSPVVEKVGTTALHAVTPTPEDLKDSMPASHDVGGASAGTAAQFPPPQPRLTDGTSARRPQGTAGASSHAADEGTAAPPTNGRSGQHLPSTSDDHESFPPSDATSAAQEKAGGSNNAEGKPEQPPTRSVFTDIAWLGTNGADKLVQLLLPYVPREHRFAVAYGIRTLWCTLDMAVMHASWQFFSGHESCEQICSRYFVGLKHIWVGLRSFMMHVLPMVLLVDAANDPHCTDALSWVVAVMLYCYVLLYAFLLGYMAAMHREVRRLLLTAAMPLAAMLLLFFAPVETLWALGAAAWWRDMTREWPVWVTPRERIRSGEWLQVALWLCPLFIGGLAALPWGFGLVACRTATAATIVACSSTVCWTLVLCVLECCDNSIFSTILARQEAAQVQEN